MNLRAAFLRLAGLLGAGPAAQAQQPATPAATDVLLLTTGQEVSGRVLTITPTELTYLPAAPTPSDTLRLPTSSVFLVRYANGTREVLTAPAPVANDDPTPPGAARPEHPAAPAAGPARCPALLPRQWPLLGCAGLDAVPGAAAGPGPDCRHQQPVGARPQPEGPYPRAAPGCQLCPGLPAAGQPHQAPPRLERLRRGYGRVCGAHCRARGRRQLSTFDFATRSAP